jgi:hypothetical protein
MFCTGGRYPDGPISAIYVLFQYAVWHICPYPAGISIDQEFCVFRCLKRTTYSAATRPTALLSYSAAQPTRCCTYVDVRGPCPCGCTALVGTQALGARFLLERARVLVSHSSSVLNIWHSTSIKLLGASGPRNFHSKSYRLILLHFYWTIVRLLWL